ncbi:Six-hairpin glycosidase [Mycena kentingensis (nom. inval.)]|nr:Six-hairpin glycosidase [Mycena kentingensis (nom. inval.)]
MNQPVRPGDIPGDIDNSNNQRYTARLSIGHDPKQAMNVVLDTGSTDLWLDPEEGMKADFHDTGVAHQITYGGGSSINGSIGQTEVFISGYTIPKQAFINVTQNRGLDACRSSGICGLVGLGFDAPDRGIQAALTKGGLDGPAIGKSVLYNIFDAHPELPRHFGLSLSRIGDDAPGAKEASLAIGAYDPNYSNVQVMPKFPVFPPGGLSWHILGKNAQVNGKDIEWPINDYKTPAGHHKIGLDSGTTNMLVPPHVREAIYSKIPGAALARDSKIRNSHWSADSDVWVVPCNTPVNFTVVFGHDDSDKPEDGYVPYHIHPLDMTDMRIVEGPDGKAYTICVGTMTNGGSISNGSTDALFGASFMRNVYTVFSFGDKSNTTAPSIQMLSKTNSADWAAEDFAATRGPKYLGSTKNAPELWPNQVIQLFDGKAPAMTGPVVVGAGAEPPRPGPVSAGFKSTAALADSSSSSLSASDPGLGKLAPAILGLLAANLLVGIVLERSPSSGTSAVTGLWGTRISRPFIHRC